VLEKSSTLFLITIWVLQATFADLLKEKKTNATT
jgi:hypothetical protein